MRLVSKADAAALAKDPKAEVTTFYVEKCKNNSIPKHFMADENKDKKTLTINGVKVTVARNKERSEYTAFCTGDGETKECFYVRNHAFLDHATEFVTYDKPKPVKKTQEEKDAEKAEKKRLRDEKKVADKKERDDKKAADKAEKEKNKPAKAKKPATGKSSAASEKAKREGATAPDGDTGAA